MTDRERREASDVPGYGRVGGIDDPVPRDEYGDDRDTVRENDAEAPDETTHAELVELPNELRAEIQSYYDGKMETAGFARRLRSIASELERHADAIEDYDEDGENH
jgi:hypothetical protein